MIWILQILTIFYIVIIVLFSRVEEEKNLYIKIFLIWLVALLSLNLGIHIHIPILSLIVLYKIYKKSYVNRKLKLIVMCMTLIMYVFAQYVTPNLSYSQMRKQEKIELDKKLFKEVDSVYTFNTNSKVQELFKKYDNRIVAFKYWVFKTEGFEVIDDADWLWYESDKKIDHYWSSTNRKPFTIEYVRLEKTGVEYYGVCSVDKSGKYSLEYVICGKMNGNMKTRFSFMGFYM